MGWHLLGRCFFLFLMQCRNQSFSFALVGSHVTLTLNPKALHIFNKSCRRKNLHYIPESLMIEPFP
uniref:Secreted protein n=1 Tax=Arundo donax TaxID=35708 RepID=A0A0A9FZ12_ARUDO